MICRFKMSKFIPKINSVFFLFDLQLAKESKKVKAASSFVDNFFVDSKTLLI